MGEILPTDARVLSNDPAFKLAPVPIPGQPLQFYMNLKKAPTDNLAVRQALLYGSNRGGIGDAVFQGFSPVGWGPLSAVTPFYNPNVNNLYAYNEDEARKVLGLGGYKDSDNDGYMDIAGVPLEVTVIQPPWGLLPQVTQLLQDQWRAVGIKAVIVPVPNFTTLLEKVKAGDYNLVAFDTPGLDPAILNTRYLGSSGDNWTGYSSGDLDNLLVRATRTTDEAERREAYAQIQAIIMQQALILPVRDYVNLNAYTAHLTGLQYDPYGWFPLLYGVAIARS
jgi:peptide/nickel transport system substrate-binding protein